jgi:hypothetical protein
LVVRLIFPRRCAQGSLQQFADSLPDSVPIIWRRTTLLALIGLVLLWATLFIATWGHWGNLTVDSGREMYVPAELVQGKTLYRDIWYLYTPASPYFNSLLYHLFGINVTVLYWAGSLSALFIALLLFVSGLHVSSWLAASTVAAVVLIQAFVPSLFCFPLPYSFGAVYGYLASCLCLALSIYACTHNNWLWMFCAGSAAAGALLAKMEFGMGCYLSLLVLIIGRYLQKRSLRRFGFDVAALLPGIAVCICVVAWMISLGGIHFLTHENIMSWPTSHFMRTYGARWLKETGFAISTRSIINIAVAGAALGIWRRLSRVTAQHGFGGRVLWSGVLVLTVVWLLAHYIKFFAALTLSLFFPRVAVFLAALAILPAAWLLWTNQFSGKILKLLVLFSFTFTLATRNLFGTEPERYSIYSNGPALLSLFVIINYLAFPKRATPGSKVTPVEFLPCLAVLIAVSVQLLPKYEKSWSYIPLTTERGVVFTDRTSAAGYHLAIGFMKEQAQRGELSLSIPEDTSLYFLSGTHCPTRVFAFTPGILDPGAMTEKTIRELEQKHVKYLVWSNRRFPEYGAPDFGVDFDRALGNYLKSHYKPVRRLGFDSQDGWTAVIWERIPGEKHAGRNARNAGRGLPCSYR